MQAAPSQAELLYKNYKVIKEKLKSQTKDDILEKYGNAATEGELPRELLLGQSEKEVEYDRAGRIIKGRRHFIKAKAAEAATDLMKANIARKEATEEMRTLLEEKRVATWGTQISDDLVLDEKLLAEALKKDVTSPSLIDACSPEGCSWLCECITKCKAQDEECATNAPQCKIKHSLMR
ncbi:hypothetical protein CMV_007838 [Castanea mollissima]|uniref:Pre-mRNA-splicing factor SLU7 n=1 Tax=Castanea mollissima TaxID=60419 RepID=A0A8J4RHP3_9ROSI|nr:hypothetical protein CMV_007838 [Castanea mollissima]